MADKPAGNKWLKAHFGLINYSFTHSSYIGNNESIKLTSRGNIEQVYGPRYAVARDTPLDHIEFALKYDDLSLDFFKEVFKRIGTEEINAFIADTPSGRYARKIGFLYEFLSGTQLKMGKEVKGNYIDLLEPEKYITGQVVKNVRWRINDNLLGTIDFCPMIRRTKSLSELLEKDVKQSIEGLKNEFPEEVFRRAAAYLYTKESKSSYEIEKEKPSTDRMERFILLLTRAGARPMAEVLSKENLIQFQNIIVDPRYAAAEFRGFQNYVGETLPNYHTLLHYICPPPAMVNTLMDGLKQAAEKTSGVDSIIKAALFAFGFVFIHPFEDGNGRLHRFMIHDILVHDGLVPQGLIIPVSAHMLNNINEYDQILETYSKPLMQRINYSLSETGEVTINNADEVAGYYRYPDLTPQAIYLAETIHATLKEDMPAELLFLLRYDEAKREIQKIVDMPDKDINWMILFLHQNKGIFPKRRRAEFAKLTDGEISAMQEAYRKVYEIM
ncbi:MAG: Fic family protein [Sediminibacterium sp.]|nr:Fic family protein [Sediminibacterium sp.]